VTIDLTRALVSVRQVCQVCAVSRRTVYNWMEAGKVEYVILPSGCRRVYADTLLKAPPEKP